jgi:hypothetical protein
MDSIAGELAQAAHHWRDDPRWSGEAGPRAVEIAALLTAHEERIAKTLEGQYDPR